MLLGDSLAKLDKLCSPRLQVILFQPILLGELQAELGNGLGDFRWRQASSDLRPELLGDEPHLVANECKECGALYFDRRNGCAHFGGRTFGTRDLATNGVVRSFSIIHQAAPNVPVPYVSSVVDLYERVSFATPDKLGKLRMPVLGVAGALDASECVATVEHLAATAPDARSVVWPDVAHMIGLEAPERLAGLILDVLEPLPRWS